MFKLKFINIRLEYENNQIEQYGVNSHGIRQQFNFGPENIFIFSGLKEDDFFYLNSNFLKFLMIV